MPGFNGGNASGITRWVVLAVAAALTRLTYRAAVGAVAGSRAMAGTAALAAVRWRLRRWLWRPSFINGAAGGKGGPTFLTMETGVLAAEVVAAPSSAVAVAVAASGRRGSRPRDR